MEISDFDHSFSSNGQLVNPLETVTAVVGRRFELIKDWEGIFGSAETW